MKEQQQQNRNQQGQNNDKRETGGQEPSSNVTNEPTPIYLTSDSTLQTPAEDRHDKNIDPRKDNSRSVSNDDIHETKADRLAGSDRAGTSERKE